IRSERVRGQEEPRLQGWTSLQPSALIPNWAIGYTLNGKEAVFATLLRICEGVPRVDAEESAADAGRAGCRIRWLVDGREEGFDYEAEGEGRRLHVVATPGAEAVRAEMPRPRTKPQRRGQFEQLLKLVNADGLRLFEEAIDCSRPGLEACSEGARSKDLHGSLEALRSHHATLSKQPCLSFRQHRRTPAEVLEYAERIMAGGFEYGGHSSFPLDVPIDWAADPFEDRNWCYALNSWSFLRAGTEACTNEPREDLAVFARRIVLDWIEQCMHGTTTNEFSWYDMVVGKRAAVLAVVVDEALRSPDVSDHALLRLLFAARLHTAYLSEHDRIIWHTNHGIYQLAGLLALTNSVPELRDAQEHREFAVQGLKQIFTSHFTDEGIHREHSPVYHFIIVNLLETVLRTGWLQQQAELESLAHAAANNVVWMVHPNGALVRVGDADLLIAEERQLQRNEAVRFILSKGLEGRMPETRFAVFPQSGYAAFRGPWDHSPFEEASFLFFSAAFHSRSHKQADDFTFEWSELGRVLVCDSGRYGYNYEQPGREYVESTRAHNTVEIDERDYSRRALDAFGSAITAWGESEGTYFVEASLHRETYFRTRHRRVLVFKPGDWLAVIDLLSSSRKHRFTQWFHFDPELKFEGDGLAFHAAIPGTRKALAVTPLSELDTLTAKCVKGQKEPRLQGWMSLRPNTLTANCAVGYSIEGKKASFVTLMSVCAPKTQLAPGAVVEQVKGEPLRVRWEADKHEVGFDYVSQGRRRRLDVLN
ncbi:MAG: alginate lyase family protein, partial [Planctomycetota bacterium]